MDGNVEAYPCSHSEKEQNKTKTAFRRANTVLRRLNGALNGDSGFPDA